MPDRFRNQLYKIIFEGNTPAGKTFDFALIIIILVSVIAVMAESVESIRIAYPGLLKLIEISITIIFTLEYILRIYCAKKRSKYIFSFLGLIDLIAILPFFLRAVLPGIGALRVFRILRAIRIFRILKLGRYLSEVRFMQDALYRSRRKIFVFLFFVFMLVIIFGSLIYLIEGEESGFDSIPKSVYWAIVTLTTVGYGDISPVTPLGQVIASLIMLMGFSIIAVPTGLVISEAVERYHVPSREPGTDRHGRTISCPECQSTGHDSDALFCKYCGKNLPEG